MTARARRRRARPPTDPLQRARQRALEREAARDPSRWGVDGEQLALPANAQVAASRDPAARLVRVRRQDVFDLFLARGKLSREAHDAVRRLQADLAILHRSPGGVASLAPKVDRSRAGDDVSDRRLAAGERVMAALDRCGAASARLLAGLCEPAALGAGREWRAVVATVTGETLADAQGALLRVACENLAGAYRTRVGRAPI